MTDTLIPRIPYQPPTNGRGEAITIHILTPDSETTKWDWGFPDGLGIPRMKLEWQGRRRQCYQVDINHHHQANVYNGNDEEAMPEPLMPTTNL